MKVLLMYSPSSTHFDALQTAAPSATLLVAGDGDEAARMIVDAEAVLGNRHFLQSLPHGRRLQWMQSNSVGVDLILQGAGSRDDFILTCVRGIYDDEMAEHALALLLALRRGLHLARDDQRGGQWTRRPLPPLHEARVLVLGWGGVGRGIAWRLSALGARVEGVRRRHCPEHEVDDGFRVWGADGWRATLPRTDALILALPRTAETHHLVGEQELSLLPAHAHVVNVGRGGTLDEAAVLRALQDGSLGGVALDVLEHEPPPADHPLRHHPRALLTPHVARSPESPPYRWEALFVENLRRFASKEPLLNVVDRKAGY